MRDGEAPGGASRSANEFPLLAKGRPRGLRRSPCREKYQREGRRVMNDGTDDR
jgi:hypothetical protein